MKIKDDYIFYRLKGKSSEEIRHLGNRISAETLIFEQQAKREKAIYEQSELVAKELLVQQVTNILESIIGNKDICTKERVRRLKEIKKML